MFIFIYRTTLTFEYVVKYFSEVIEAVFMDV